jgi:hypothetical protein
MALHTGTSAVTNGDPPRLGPYGPSGPWLERCGGRYPPAITTRATPCFGFLKGVRRRPQATPSFAGPGDAEGDRHSNGLSYVADQRPPATPERNRAPDGAVTPKVPELVAEVLQPVEVAVDDLLAGKLRNEVALQKRPARRLRGPRASTRHRWGVTTDGRMKGTHPSGALVGGQGDGLPVGDPQAARKRLVLDSLNTTP